MTRRPNILFIVVDDQAAWTLSGQGHPNTHTPQLDQLAAQGETLKLVRDMSGSQGDELYDLVDDPQEQHNRIADPSPPADAARRHLASQLQQWMTAIHDPLLLQRTA